MCFNFLPQRPPIIPLRAVLGVNTNMSDALAYLDSLIVQVPDFANDINQIIDFHKRRHAILTYYPFFPINPYIILHIPQQMATWILSHLVLDSCLVLYLRSWTFLSLFLSLHMAPVQDLLRFISRELWMRGLLSLVLDVSFPLLEPSSFFQWYSWSVISLFYLIACIFVAFIGSRHSIFLSHFLSSSLTSHLQPLASAFREVWMACQNQRFSFACRPRRFLFAFPYDICLSH